MMFHSNKTLKLVFGGSMLLVVLLASVALVQGQLEGMTLPGMEPAAMPPTPAAGPAAGGLGQLRQMFQFDPVVDTGDSPLGGRKVYVHVPGFFDLKLDTRANRSGLRMTQTVLSGLVNIFMDRTRDPATSRLTGPISVKVGGLTMYQNAEARAMGNVPTPIM